MRIAIFIILLGVLLSSKISFAQNPVKKNYYAKWVLTKGGSLKVAGSTNVNKFTCEISDYSSPDTITVYNPGAEQSLPVRGILKLNIDAFDCHNPMMTSDLYKTLKGKQFPKMFIQFVSLNKFPEFTSPNNNVSGVVNIELAGAIKSYVVNYAFYKDASGSVIRLIGRRRVNFGDFNLIPPRKLGGLIRTKEELDVEFNLLMRVL